MFLRNRFLGTTAFLLGPNDPPGGGSAAEDQQQQDNGGGTDENASGQGIGGAENEAEGGDAEGAEGDGDDGTDDDDDPLAGLDEAARAKAEAAIAREVGWRDRQLSRAHARARQAQEDAEAARLIAERNGGKQPDGQQQGDPAVKPLTQEEIRREAQRLTAQERYDEGCNQTDADGRKYYGNDGWGKVTERLKNFGGIDQTDMAAILATDNPAVVLNELARNPEEYERVMSLPPAKRNNAFVKLGLKSPPKKAAAVESKRPAEGGGAPPRVLPGRRNTAPTGTVNLYDDKTDDDSWYKMRNETRRKKFSTAQ